MRAAIGGQGANGGQHATVLLAGAETGGRLAVVETVEARGAALPLHRHHWEDEVLYVVAGELAVRLGGAWRRVPAGAAVLLPRGVEHAVAAATPEARVLTILTPAGFEGFHREWGTMTAGVATDLERLVALAARYGCEITGPPPTPPAPMPATGTPGGRSPGGQHATPAEVQTADAVADDRTGGRGHDQVDLPQPAGGGRDRGAVRRDAGALRRHMFEGAPA